MVSRFFVCCEFYKRFCIRTDPDSPDSYQVDDQSCKQKHKSDKLYFAPSVSEVNSENTKTNPCDVVVMSYFQL